MLLDSSYDWNFLTSLAYSELIDLGITSFPADPLSLTFKNAKIISCQKYSELSGIPVSTLTLMHEFDDAYYVGKLRVNLNLILYNEDRLTQRLHHTLWHEIGHIRCGHTLHGEREEVEAHFFAGQAHAPNAVIREIRNRGYTINRSLLMDYFGLSGESADKKLSYFSNYSNAHPNDFDAPLMAQLMPFIDRVFPRRAALSFDDYFDDLENARLLW